MKQWTNYWQNSRSLNSFSEGQSALGYHGEMLYFWQNQLSALSNGAKVLDIGTGNGALAILCYQYAQTLGFVWELLGIDAADINPKVNIYSDESINKALQNISFRGNTFIERSELESGDFDFICSQYAIEYSDLTQSLPEICRLLAPNGRFCALMHATESEIVADSRLGLSFLNILLDKSPFLKEVGAVLVYAEKFIKEGKSLADDVEFKRLNEVLLFQVKWLKSKALDMGCDSWFNSILSKIAPLLYQLKTENVAIFDEYCKQLFFYRMRIRDQLDSVIDEKRKQLLLESLERLHVQYCFSELFVEGKHVGITLVIHK
ncbi:class I SAM-dependent methyltransferase [Shewanella sp. LC6]|uniref:class I SAM-dependent methyltransferase n=1 Tax=unclassified Shewanella TaxID=196818 RepID=UPI000B34A0A5|nr:MULTISPECIES: class I SAM-dependent methyltransferase [unclassified Shewanella]MDH1470921.1 class I SAM-dependent methyltransferase [Shewanella sp. GD03713]QQK60560.1 class I SAM-dependent methyltransferase [Shewanella sp. LC6]QXN26432.1 class I SAM-dependent methyltransferase [Shewanella putrefaciens]TPE57648.1 class I SAM-dependent methyltransferase [Shewanella sp. LC2]